MRRLLLFLLAASVSSASLSGPAFASSHHHTITQAPATTGNLELFTSESAAQKHCPSDAVVWLDTNSGIYYENGMRWYGNTNSGAYVCRTEADKAGDRDTRNGQ